MIILGYGSVRMRNTLRIKRKEWYQSVITRLTPMKVANKLLALFFNFTSRIFKNHALTLADAKITMLEDRVKALRQANKRLLHQQSASWGVPLDEVAGLLNWPSLLNGVEISNGFHELVKMMSLFSSQESTVNSPSSCWMLLATKNCDQLLEYGYKNFKRTIAHNYFNFLVQKGDPQITAAEALFDAETLNQCQEAARAIPYDQNFAVQDQTSYFYFQYLLLAYVNRIDQHHYLNRLEEPTEGNPLTIIADGKRVSQDLANSLIEYYAMSEVVPFKNMKTVLEIGGGYGRNAFVLASLNPNMRIVMVDILPALYIAQRYLSSIFSDRKIFRARQFTSFKDVAKEMKAADIVFLLPHQLALLPDNYIDLTINISSFGEMGLEQIKWYFKEIDRITNQYFYMKQWDVSKNPFDNLTITKSDYPSYDHWHEIYQRNCVIQNEFFETLYKVN